MLQEILLLVHEWETNQVSRNYDFVLWNRKKEKHNKNQSKAKQNQPFHGGL